MKKGLLILLLGLSSFSFAQAWPQIDSVEMIPNPAVEGEDALAVLHVTMGTTSGWLGATFEISDDVISIESCYLSWGFTAITEFADTLNLGDIPEGPYTLSFTAYSSSSDTACVPVDTSDYSESIVVEPNPFAKVSEEPQEVVVYPNPAYNFLFFSSSSEHLEYEIYDQRGAVITVGRMNDGKVDISRLASGIYYVDIKAGKGPVRHKFIKE